jgi:hypothetical protein
MQSSRTPQNRGPKFLDAKVLIAVLSLAVIIGIWSMLANNAFGLDQLAFKSTAAQPQPESGLPTLVALVPLATLAVNPPGDTAPVNQTQPDTAGQLPLRVVAVPTPVIVQKNAPQISGGVPVVSPDGGGGGGGSKAVTSTKSSR